MREANAVQLRPGSQLIHGCTNDGPSIISSAAISKIFGATRLNDFAVVATARGAFTLFEARSINFAIVVYSQFMQVEGRLALSQHLGITEGNMAKKAKKKKAKKTAKKKKK